MFWKTFLLLIVLPGIFIQSYAQDLDDILDQELGIDNGKTFVSATFKSPLLISGHSVKNPAKGDLVFLISHRFGEINQGLKEFFGLDISTIRLGFEYGLSDRFSAGIGRSSFNKVVDGYLKYKLIKQSTGPGSIPVSVSVVLASSIQTKTWSNPELDYKFLHRLDYNSEILIARKFSSRLSYQLTSGLIHRNLVDFEKDPNQIFYIAMGARYKISNRVSFNYEYYYPFSSRIRSTHFNPLSLGIDLETGGHVFQLMLSNSRGMTPAVIVSDTKGNWFEGDIHFGFNIIRTF